MAADRKYTRKEIEGRNTSQSAAIIIDNEVYDVTQFLEEHPGGAERLLACGGGDASRCFHEVGHSDAALEWRRLFRVGTLVAEDRWPLLAPERAGDAAPAPPPPVSARALLDACGPPLLLAALAALLFVYLF